MSSRFRRAFYRLAPSWLTSGEGELVNYSLGLVKDAFLERLRLGLQARFPERAPSDAFPSLGRDRRIVRGIDETDADYAARLLRWLEDWRTAGNPFALMQQLRAYCNTTVRIRTVDRRGNWYTLDRDGTRSYLFAQGNWDWDGVAASSWSRFWVIIYPTSDGSPWSEGPNWGDADLWGGAWGTAGYTWGTTATPDQVASVQRIVRDWKPAGTRCENIIIAFDDASFAPATPAGPPMPDGTWGNWSVGDPRAPSRLATARYWDGP